MSYPKNMQILDDSAINRTLRIYTDKDGYTHDFPEMSDFDGYVLKVGDVVAYPEEYENAQNAGKEYTVLKLYVSPVLGEMCWMVETGYLDEFPLLPELVQTSSLTDLAQIAPVFCEYVWKVSTY